jgi:hypothetical protein
MVPLSADPIWPDGTGTFKCSVAGDTVTIGQTTARRQEATRGGKVPETLFYDTPQNLGVMEAMLQDFLLGEHLLLVGNQANPIIHYNDYEYNN